MREERQVFRRRLPGEQTSRHANTCSYLDPLPLLFLLCFGLPFATCRDVYIAHWRPSIPPEVMDALFGEYLNEAVGQHMRPPVNFVPVPVQYEGTPQLHEFAQSAIIANIDFYYLPSQPGLCGQLGPMGGAPLLNSIEGHGSAVIGGVVFARADNTDVNSLQDIKGRVVSSLSMGTIPGYFLQDDLAAKAGVNTLQDAKQVRMYLNNDVRDVIQDVLLGTADVGYMPALGITAPLLLDGGPLKVIAQKPTPSLPFPTSTEVSPSTTFFYAKRADHDPELVEKVVEGLLRMNMSLPAAKAADIRGWQHAINHEGLRSIMIAKGTMYLDDDKRLACVDMDQLGSKAYEVLKCPPGTFKRRLDAIADQCAKVDATCPPGAVCFCKPCMEAQAVQLTPLNSMAAIDKCEKTTVCGETEQGRALEFEITDNLNRANVTFTYTVLRIEAGMDTPIGGVAQKAGGNRYRFQAVLNTAGLLLLQVFAAEEGKEAEQAPLSPVFVNVMGRACPSRRTASLDGRCVCDSRSVAFSARCVETLWIVLGAMAALLLLSALAVRHYLRRRLQAADVLWRIKATDLEFPDPPQVLGQGMHGEVLKAKYRGTDVAVKALLPFRSNHAGSNTSALELLHAPRPSLRRALSLNAAHTEPIELSFAERERSAGRGRADGAREASLSDHTLRRLSLLASLQPPTTADPTAHPSSSPARSPALKRRRKTSCNDLGVGLPELLAGSLPPRRAASKLESSMHDVTELDPIPDPAPASPSAPHTAHLGLVSLSVSPVQQHTALDPPPPPDAIPTGPPAGFARSPTGGARVRVVGASGAGEGSKRGGRARGGSVTSEVSGLSGNGRVGSGLSVRSHSNLNRSSSLQSRTDSATSSQRAARARAPSLGERTVQVEEGGGSWWLVGSGAGRGSRSWWKWRRTTGAESAEREAFVREMRLLSRLRHPRITTVMGAVLSRERPMLVMELMRYGSLQDLYMNEVMELDGDVLLGMLKDVADGVFFLHSFHPCIVHGDLKAANILVDSMFRAKVSDLGMAGGTKFAGTPFWMAPELLTGRAAASTASDVFALGVTLCETLQRRAPYEGEDPITVLKHVIDPAVQKRPGISAAVNAALHQLMQSCWAADPALRPTMEQVRDLVASISPLALDGMWGGETDRHSDPRWQSQSDTVVYEMYPKHVAEALMRGEEPQQDQSDSCSVFFSDVVGFTALSAAMESHQVSDMLDRLFSRLDQLAAHHGVYKLDTIGDCYIGVANLVEEQGTDHVARIAAFSLDVIKAAAEVAIDPTEPAKGAVRMRVGFDVGPVVGHLVGRKHKKYTIFGNTVNTASRMESTSDPERVQCTQRAAALLLQQDPTFKLAHRGAIQVKGRGTMETYWVEGRAEASQPLPTPPHFPAPVAGPATLPPGSLRPGSK